MGWWWSTDIMGGDAPLDMEYYIENACRDAKQQDEDDEIELIELFGGIGAPRKAMTRLGLNFKVLDYVEIDKYAVLSYNAIYGENYDPKDITEYGDDTNE